VRFISRTVPWRILEQQKARVLIWLKPGAVRPASIAGMRIFLVGLALALAAAAAAQTGGTELDRAYDEMLAAQTQLQRAQAAHELGFEPQPGERLGTAGGQSRLSDEYWERQKRLEEDVALARQRLEQAIARWNSLR
jgi:hypothetical protein